MDNQQENQNEFISIPLATMTFGKNKSSEFTFNNNSNNNSLKSDFNNNLTLKNNENIFNQISENKIKLSNENNTEKPEEKINKKKSFHHLSTFSNKINSHNSFISPILYSLYYMKLIRNYIINEAQIPKDKNLLLYHLKKILSLMSENKKIDLTKFRNCLAENFQNRRKFLKEHPDDPLDLYFILINALHSNYIEFPEKEISDYSCREKCCSHHYLWMDISRIDLCECGLSNKRLFSNHNYIFDIPIEKIFDLMKNYILINDINNCDVKVIEKNHFQNYNLSEFYGKLFFYYNFLMKNIKFDCPVNGIRCNYNNARMKLVINNIPSYLVFYLQQNLNFTIYDILKNFVLIPRNFNLSNIFDVSNLNGKNNDYSFNLLGFVLFKISKTFSSVFKDSLSNNWLYYDDEYVFCFNNLYEVITFCLKNSIIPIMLFYKRNINSNNNMYDAINDNISSEQFNNLEKYALNIDSIQKFLDNKIRINEDFLGNYSNFINNKNSFINNNNDNIINKDFYICLNCQNKNKINEKICQKCGTNNMENKNTIIKNKQNENKNKYNNINSINIINNINPINNHINNLIDSSNQLNIIQIPVNNNNHISCHQNSNCKKKKNLKMEEDENDSNDFRLKKNYDMPKPYIPNKDIPIKIQPINNQNNQKTLSLNIKNKNNSSPKNVSKYITSKTNPNKIITNQNQNLYTNEALKKIQNEIKKTYNNENEDRIIPYEIANKKRPNTVNKNSYVEIQEYNLRYSQQKSKNNMKLSNNSSEIKKKDNNNSNRISTPKNSHSGLFDKKIINKSIERIYSERKSKDDIKDKKLLRNFHSKSPNGLYFVSGNNNLNNPINYRTSSSNVNVNLGIKTSEQMYKNNFKRKNKYL